MAVCSYTKQVTDRYKWNGFTSNFLQIPSTEHGHHGNVMCNLICFSSGNIFSTLRGLLFEWTLLKDTTARNQKLEPDEILTYGSGNMHNGRIREYEPILSGCARPLTLCVALVGDVPISCGECMSHLSCISQLVSDCHDVLQSVVICRVCVCGHVTQAVWYRMVHLCYGTHPLLLWCSGWCIVCCVQVCSVC